jgi:MEMO1 family protein
MFQMDRREFVSGRFYPSEPEELRKSLSKYFGEDQGDVHVHGAILPHAGYIYSGSTAGAVVSQIRIPDTVIIIGPNHTGKGEPISVYPEGRWHTPLGFCDINEGLAGKIISLSDYAKADTVAHECEHSIEVILPFLQMKNDHFSFVPISMGTRNPSVAEELIHSIHESTKDKDVLYIASSDFTHYEPEYTAKARDKAAIRAIKEMDSNMFLSIVAENEMSICGVTAIYMVIELAKMMGASSGKLLAYSNSGEMSHDFSNVVTYAGIAFK